jgi:hypothetical protein
VSSLGQNEIAVAIFVGTTVHSYEGMWACSLEPIFVDI